MIYGSARSLTGETVRLVVNVNRLRPKTLGICLSVVRAEEEVET